MIVYIPVYDRGRFVVGIDSEILDYFTSKRVCRKLKSGFVGDIYDDRIYLTHDDAVKYWNKEPAKCYRLSDVRKMEDGVKNEKN